MELASGADPAQLARLLAAACELDEERRRARSAEEREEELALSHHVHTPTTRQKAVGALGNHGTAVGVPLLPLPYPSRST